MALTNTQMIERGTNFFARMARSRRILARAQRCWNAGGLVRVGTYTRITDYKPKHRDMFKVGAKGNLLIQSGKRWDICDGCSFQFTA